MKKEDNVAIVLAAGRGSRMKSDVQKQYLQILGKPILYYSLKEFQNYDAISRIILVTGENEIEYCREEIVKAYRLDKAEQVIAGGKERYHSVYEGLKAAAGSDHVFIHDGARPFLDGSILTRCLEAVRLYHACVAGMPVKDTIKISDENMFAARTPDRRSLWMVQTPQTFDYELVKGCYDKLMRESDCSVTDDAMAVEKYGNCQVKLVEGSYRNIKITTPEDMAIAEAFLKKR
ncbi:MAG: 2-C-methyl-D-erythritol 4-phosphate cytidylyltransferase [Lachnospiraceae bacterium]|nr:2-C-methyl-D-erythritol 4-phosphate cytidylyltransferase [Lachnospiraceae bacterium]